MKQKKNIKMNENKQKIKYILYARKSTESEDRQVQSIDDQVNKLKELAKLYKLNIVEVLIEQKSARIVGQRTIFNKMLEKIEAGEANGILCWQNNRIARNMEEGGRIINLLQDGIIKSIRTHEKEHLPDDNVLVLCVEMGVANQFSLDLSKNVKRGIDSKVQRGDKPGFVGNGFLNSRNKETGLPCIIPDPERFDLIRKMFDLVLTSRYSITQILNIANKDWSFITKRVKKVGGKPLTRGTLYGILTSVLYAGWFMHKGEMHKGNHKAMITLQEFDRVQEILGRKGRPRPKQRYFPFAGGIIRCGECLSAISAEIKKERYVYYHCTCKNDSRCSQRDRKWIKVEKLEAQIKREIDRITILPEFLEWALARIKEYYNQEIEDRDNVYETQHKTMVSCQKQLDKLVDMKLNDQIADEQYNEKRNALLKQIDNLKDKLDNTHERVEDELRIVERAVNFATRAHASFLKGNYETKKKILIGLGQVGISQNFSLKDGILRIEPNPVLEPIKIDYPEYQEQYYKLELHKTPPEARTNEQNEGAAKLCSAWSSTIDNVRTQVNTIWGQSFNS